LTLPQGVGDKKTRKQEKKARKQARQVSKKEKFSETLFLRKNSVYHPPLVGGSKYL